MSNFVFLNTTGKLISLDETIDQNESSESEPKLILASPIQWP